MTPAAVSDTDGLQDRVESILADAKTQLSRLDEDDESRDQAIEELRDVGTRADDVVSENDPKTLLAAFDALEDPSAYESKSLAAVMTESDPGSVAALRTLLTLSKLPDDDDDALSDHLETLRGLGTLSADRASGPEVAEAGGDSEPVTESEEVDEATVGGEGETEVDREDETVASAVDADADSQSVDPDQIRAKLQEGIDEFREGVQSYRDSLEGDADAGSTSADTDSEGDDSTSRSTAHDGSRVSARRGAGTTFSTMPSRDRRDMRGVKRFSTMRNERGSGSE